MIAEPKTNDQKRTSGPYGDHLLRKLPCYYLPLSTAEESDESLFHGGIIDARSRAFIGLHS